MLNYIQNIRSIVGHMPLILAAVPVIVLDDQNRILLQLRSDTKDWGIPGGYMELGETPVQTGKRELFEEAGLTIENLKLVDVFAGPEIYTKYPNGDEVYGVDIVYYTRDFSGHLKKDSESLDLQFFGLNNLPVNIKPSSKYILEKVLPYIKQHQV